MGQKWMRWLKPNFNVRFNGDLKRWGTMKAGSKEQRGAINEQNIVDMGGIPYVGGLYREDSRAYQKRKNEVRYWHGRNKKYSGSARGTQSTRRQNHRDGAGAGKRYGEAYYRSPRNIPGNYAVSGIPSGWEEVRRSIGQNTGKRNAGNNWRGKRKRF